MAVRRLLVLTASALLAVACAAPTNSPSTVSPDRDAVLATVQRFFAAMHARDPKLAAETVVPDGVFVSTRREDGKRVEHHFSNREWIERLGKETTVLLEEFTGTPEVRIEGDVASVFGAYRFTIDGKPSHTGVDLFGLVRTNDGWRISGGAYTIERP